MLELFRYVLLSLGLTYAISQAGIFKPVRTRLADLGRFIEALVYCPACTGFWVGLALSNRFWPFDSTSVLEGAFASMALGAVWSQVVPPVWEIERNHERAEDGKQN